MVERRKHKRYPMPHGTFVIFRNKLGPLRKYSQMSIGEIAMVLYKSEPESMGQVKNLSLGGIAFDGNYSGLPDAENVELDLLMTEKGIYLHDIPYVTVPIRPAGRGKKKRQNKRTDALCFQNLDAEQKDQLQELLTHQCRFAKGDQTFA